VGGKNGGGISIKETRHQRKKGVQQKNCTNFANNEASVNKGRRVVRAVVWKEPKTQTTNEQHRENGVYRQKKKGWGTMETGKHEEKWENNELAGKGQINIAL